MVTFRRVNDNTVEAFFASFQENEKLQIVRDNNSVAIFKSPSGTLAITIFKNTNTVTIQGRNEEIAQFVTTFQTLLEVQNVSASASSSEPQNHHTATQEATPARKRRKVDTHQLHNLRFNDFRDDLYHFMKNWKPTANQTQLNEEVISQLTSKTINAETQTEES